jgi:hypothetical protein
MSHEGGVKEERERGAGSDGRRAYGAVGKVGGRR